MHPRCSLEGFHALPIPLGYPTLDRTHGCKAAMPKMSLSNSRSETQIVRKPLEDRLNGTPEKHAQGQTRQASEGSLACCIPKAPPLQKTSASSNQL